MQKMKSIKSALFTSILLIVVCLSMFAGTTFAWFTDSVTSSGNIIQSGTLDVEMYWADGTKTPDDNAGWQDASKGAIFNYENWEPGYTMVRHIKIVNKGSLALKYKVVITAEGAVSNLTDVIDVYYEDPAMKIENGDALTEEISIGNLTAVLNSVKDTAQGDLDEGESDIVTIALKMRESASNDYQNKTVGPFSVNLIATQFAKESDSFGTDYDKDAKYPVVTSNIKSALSDDAEVKTNVTGVIFGTYEQYGANVSGVTGSDIGDGVTLYRVPNATTFASGSATTYTLYFLSEGKISLVGDATAMFRDMKGLTVFDGSNLDMSKVTSVKYLFRDSSNLTEIIGAEDWDLSNVTSTRGMLYNCSKLEKLDVSKWDVSKVEDAGWMFYYCSAVTELDVSNWDTSSLTFAKSIFCNNEQITEIDLSNWDLSKVTDTSYMFFRCYKLEDANLSNCDVSKIECFESMFKHARAMETLDLSNWDTSSATDMNHMFANCGNLKNLDISGFDTSKVTTMAWMFYEIEATTIYVGDKWSLASIANLDEGVYSHKIASAPLVGGKGTTCRQIMDLDSKCVAEGGARFNATARYMIVDGGAANPGLLTYKA